MPFTRMTAVSIEPPGCTGKRRRSGLHDLGLLRWRPGSARPSAGPAARRTSRSPAPRTSRPSCRSRSRRQLFPGRPRAMRLNCTPRRRASLLQVLLPDLDRLQPLIGVDDMLDLVARPRGLHQHQPVAAGQVPGLRHDLDDVAVAQCVAQRHDAAVDLGSDAGVAHVGVDGVSEIDRSCVARQDHYLAFGRERVNLFRIQVHLQGRHELARVVHIALPLDQVPEPGDALVVFGGAFLAFFVLPVRRDALFRDAVHLLGADLHLEMLPVRPYHGRVQRLVQIRARDGDEVLDASGNGPPLVVDHAQRRVAVLHRIGDDPQRHQVVHLVDADLCRFIFW